MTIQHISIDGGQLAVDVQGNGPLVVCSPALGDHRDAFTPLSAQLVSAGYRVATYDLRGHGESSAEFNSYGDQATSRDILAIIKTLGSPAIVVGASLSGGAAVIAAAEEPGLISGLVLIGPFLRNPMDSAVVKAIFNVLLWRPLGPILWSYQSAKLWPGLEPEALKERVDKTMSLLQRPGRWRAFQQTVIGADHSVVKPSIGGVSCPVLVVMGDSDPDWTDPLAEAEWVASNFSDVETMMVERAGHAPMLEKPDDVGLKITQFARKCLAPGGTD